MIRRYGNSKVYQSLFLAILAASVCTAVFYMLHKERMFIKEQAGNQIGAEERVRDMQRIEKFMNERTEESDRIASYFKKATDTVAVIESIETLGLRYGTDLSIRQAETKTDPSVQLELIADAEGTWEEVFAFMNGLEQLPHPHMLRKIDLTDLGIKERQALWRLSFILEVPLSLQ